MTAGRGGPGRGIRPGRPCRGGAGSGAGVDPAVDAVRVEPAGGGYAGGQVDDVQDLAGGAAEGQAVGVGGDDVGLAVQGDALVIAGC